tara:strand:- start:279 stop:503 length:225 start_codon:yes stop_codon:yes gene_type:complete
MISIEDNNILNFKIDTIDKIIESKNKAKKIIESCENDIQLSNAKRFIYLYKKATDDVIGFSELEVLLLSKRMSL